MLKVKSTAVKKSDFLFSTAGEHEEPRTGTFIPSKGTGNSVSLADIHEKNYEVTITETFQSYFHISGMKGHHEVVSLTVSLSPKF